MDYVKILIAYMTVVGENEGVDFLGDEPVEDCNRRLNLEEAVELARIRDMSRKQWADERAAKKR